MAERRKPIVTELALADALDQLVNLIEELRADADLLRHPRRGLPAAAGGPLHSRRDRSPCLEREPAGLRDRIASNIGEAESKPPVGAALFRSSRTVEVHTATTRFRFRRFRTQQAPDEVNRCQQAYMAI